MASRDPCRRAPVQPAGWTCAHCGESSPASFDACWNCGATCDGRPNPDFQAEREVPTATATAAERPDRQPALRQFAVTVGIVGLALVMLRFAGSAAFVLTPLAYLYFVLFSPKDRPAGHIVVKVMILLAVGSLCGYHFFSALFR